MLNNEMIAISTDDVAVIGIGCRFPGDSNNKDLFWENLLQNRDCIEFPSSKRVKTVNNENLKRYKAGYINNIEYFDSKRYGISAQEAKKIDPQQRLMLMVTEEAILDAGYEISDFNGTNTGVFVGVSSNDYSHIIKNELIDIYYITGNALSIVANRVSYVYNLTGPSISIDTACSSSLVAISQAYQSVISGDIEQAICGGVNVLLNPDIFKSFLEARMLSVDAKCKTFDDSANGYVRGEGCGVIILKLLNKAISDNDKIYAVIKGTAVNQDGKSNGITAQNGLAQKMVIEKALKKAKLSPDDINYIEAHGTGTKLGDPIEMNCLGGIFGKETRQNKCYVGSVKTNIGHLEAAAGIAGFIKTVLMIYNNKLISSCNFNKLNSYIKINLNKIAIADKSEDIDIINCGVSSFGFGGTNCHVILQKYNMTQQSRNSITSSINSNIQEIWAETKEYKQTKEDNVMDLLDELKKQTEYLKKNNELLENLIQRNYQSSILEDTSQENTFIYNELIKIISHTTAFSVDDLNINSQLKEELGIDSLMFGRIVLEISKNYPNSNKSEQELFNIFRQENLSIGMLVDYLSEMSKDIIKPQQSFEISLSQKTLKNTPVTTKNNNIRNQYIINEFPEYQFIKNRLDNATYNPYFKANSGIARDLININNKDYINFATYNYLGLNGNEKVVEKTLDAVRKYGTSVSGSRMISGEICIHKELEDKISDFLGVEDTIVYIGGFLANVSVISAICSSEDLILHDSLIHNSIIQGCLLSGAIRQPFKHNDMEDLEKKLKESRSRYRRVLIIAEGVYSMDGDICDLPVLIQLKIKYKTLLMIDEAHSIGTIGNTGRGVGEYFNVDKRDVDIWMGTMSKSLASCGGYISGTKELIQMLKFSSSGFIYSVGISPANTASSLASLEYLESNSNLVHKLTENSTFFLSLAKEAGLNTGDSSNTPIIPLIIKDSNRCISLSKQLFDVGINVMPIVYPAVEENYARLRFFMSSLHTEEQIRYTIEILKSKFLI